MPCFKIVLAAITAAVAVSSTPALAQDASSKIKWTGDARLRLERDQNFCFSTSNNSCNQSDNYVNKMRFRLIAEGKVNDSLTARARVSTGSTQYATQFNLGGASGAGFSPRGVISLDIASLTYNVSESLKVDAGKFMTGFWQAAPMVWNSENSVEGVQVKWNGDMGGLKPYATLAYYNIVDRSSIDNTAPSATAGSDITLFGAQLGTKWTADNMWANLAVGSYNTNTKDLGAATATGVATGTGVGTIVGNRGNTLTTGGAFANDYKTMAVDAEFGIKTGFAPVKAYGTYVTNADGDQKNATLGGVLVGELKEVGSWSFNFNHRDVGRDAFLSNLGDVAFNQGGGTGQYGYNYSFGYQAWQSASIVATFQTGKHQQAAGGTYGTDTYYIDFNTTF